MKQWSARLRLACADDVPGISRLSSLVQESTRSASSSIVQAYKADMATLVECFAGLAGMFQDEFDT